MQQLLLLLLFLGIGIKVGLDTDSEGGVSSEIISLHIPFTQEEGSFQQQEIIIPISSSPSDRDIQWNTGRCEGFNRHSFPKVLNDYREEVAPEPGTFFLLGISLLFLVGIKRISYQF